MSGKRRPIKPASSDQMTVELVSHALTRTTSGRLVKSRESSRPHFSRASAPWVAASRRSSPVISISRRTRVAVFPHSQSETALVRSEDSATPMPSARLSTHRSERMANGTSE